jgi:hypothetical protein
MAADPSTGYLSTGSGLDVRVWKGGKRCMSLSASLCALFICEYTSDDWEGHGVLGVPRKSADNCDEEIVLTGLHWHIGSSDVRLITTYRHHGIQCVLFCV